MLYRVFFSAFLIAILFFNATRSKAQDTVGIMYYNILNYPYVEPERDDTLRKIVQHIKPDLFLVNELQTAQGGTDILNNALNVNGINYYQQATFYDGTDSDNLLYYNSDKFGLKSQNQISTSLRDISEYIVYFKSSDIATTTDTIFYYLYSLHLKASQGSSEEQQRDAEIKTLKDYLNAKSYTENIFVGGDFNMYTSSEPAYGRVTSYGITLNDPINTPGNWHNESQYSDIHTQSTRTSQFGGGAYGGMDDRFDIIFVGNDVLSGDNNVEYVNNTYRAIGQDGNRFNGNLISPVNNSEPDSVITAMYYMSDHIPVYMETAVGRTVGITEHGKTANAEIEFRYFSGLKKLKLKAEKEAGELSVKVINASGQTIVKQRFEGKGSIDLSALSPGIYIATALSGDVKISRKFMIR